MIDGDIPTLHVHRHVCQHPQHGPTGGHQHREDFDACFPEFGFDQGEQQGQLLRQVGYHLGNSSHAKQDLME